MYDQRDATQPDLTREPLELDIVIDARPATVFQFLVSPAHVGRWLGAGA